MVKNNSISGTSIAYSGNPIIKGSLSLPCAGLRTSHIIVSGHTSRSPAFLHSGSGHATPITHPAFTAKLRKVLSQADLPASKFSGHSFRRGGATFAFRCGAPVELISLQGDWSSDAVLLYIAQPLERRISMASMIARNMPEH